MSDNLKIINPGSSVLPKNLNILGVTLTSNIIILTNIINSNINIKVGEITMSKGPIDINSIVILDTNATWIII